MFVVHGAGEHCNRYDDLARLLTGLDFLVFANDHGEYPEHAVIDLTGSQVVNLPKCSDLPFQPMRKRWESCGGVWTLLYVAK